MSFADSINDQAQRLGGKWVKLAETGDTIVGDLVDIEERVKSFDGEVVLSRKSGLPRTEWVITLATDLRDPGDATDDGVRKVAAAESLQRAIKAHLRDSGQRVPSSWGGRMAIAVKVGRPSPTSQVEEWSIAYRAPTGADALNAQLDQPVPTPTAPAVDASALV